MSLNDVDQKSCGESEVYVIDEEDQRLVASVLLSFIDPDSTAETIELNRDPLPTMEEDVDSTDDETSPNCGRKRLSEVYPDFIPKIAAFITNNGFAQAQGI